MQPVTPASSPANRPHRYRVRVRGTVCSSIGPHTLDLVTDKDDLMLGFAAVMIRLGAILHEANSHDLPHGSYVAQCELEVQRWDS